MFGNAGVRQDTSYLSNSPNWGDINKTVERLIDDVPRATSAPPHLANQVGLGSTVSDGRWTPSADGFSDLRLEEDYPQFYQSYAEAGRKLPPPMEDLTVYNQLPTRLQQQLTSQQQQQQQALAARHLSPSPGLETISEQRTSSNLNPHVLQALANSLGGERGSSPAPPHALEYSSTMTPPISHHNDNDHAALMQQLVAAANSMSINGPSPTPPPLSRTPPLPSHTPPLVSHTPPPLPSQTPPLPPGTPNNAQAQVMANAAAYAAAMATGPGGLQQGYIQPNVMQSMEFQAAYQAAYQAALQQHAAAQSVLIQQGQGHLAPHLAGHFAGQHSQVAAQVATQLAVNPHYYANPNINAAAAAAAAAAVQNMMTGRGPANGVLDYDRQHDRDDRRGTNRRGRRDRRDVDRDRDRDREHDDLTGSFTSRYQNLEEILGQVLTVAKDQNGCRFLQRKFDEGGASAIALVFPEILNNLIELMTDPFGNYLTQKLLDRCSEDQRLQVLKKASEKQALVEVALNTHGTRAVQKLIETLSSPEQVQLVIESLRPGVVALIRDLNGNHVIQRCLQRLGPEDSQFVYDAAAANAMEIATHRHGCCVLQRCIDFATPAQKQDLVEQIAANALALSQDGFGNYCLQYILELGQTQTNAAVMEKLLGHFADLSQQKFSSNVVEKCLKLTGTELVELRERIVREIIQSPLLPRLLQDPYANFVIQTALTVTSGQLHSELVDAIRPYLPSLRGTPFGKRILSKINIKL